MNNKTLGILITAIAVILIIGLIWWAGTNTATEPPENGAAENAPVTETGDAETDAAATAPEEPAIAVADGQTPNARGVTVNNAALVNAGYIVIHADAEGQPGAVIGASDLLEPARYEGFTVLLDRETQPGETLYAMLHTDDGDGTYNFPGDDAPTTDADGLVVVTGFTVAEAAAADVQVDTQLDAEVSTGDAAEETNTEVQVITMESGNFFFGPDTITVQRGQPVRIELTNSGYHTFTVDELGVNTTFSDDTAIVEFTPEQTGTFAFYCAVGNHRAQGMEGTITVTE